MAKNKFDYKKLNVKNCGNTTNIVDTDSVLIQNYLQEAAKYKVLDNETEQKYIALIKAGDVRSSFYKDAIARSHSAFVIGFAKKHCHGDDNIFMDLVQEGNYGMMVALENYDITSKAKFITYANAWILKFMYKFIEENELVHRPNRSKTFGIEKRVREEFYRKNGYEPSAEELLEIFHELGIHIKHKEDLMEISYVSLDQPLYQNSEDDEDDKMLLDIAEEEHLEDDIDKEYVIEAIRFLLEKLSYLERKVIEKRFGFNGSIDKDNTTIADELGLTVDDVRKYGDSAMQKLQKYKSFFA